MWWVNKFGSISGPYSEEQIRKLVQTNRLTRLCKISEDRAFWTRLDESVFWVRAASGAEELELPSAVLPGLKIGGSETKHKPDDMLKTMPTPATADSSTKSDIEHEERNGEGERIPSRFRFPGKRVSGESQNRPSRRKLYVWCGLGALLVVALVAGAVAVGSMTGRSGGGAQTPTNERANPSDEKANETGKEKPAEEKTSGNGVLFESIKRKVAIIRTTDGSGTGFFLRMGDKVYLVTNEHVIRSADAPDATLIDGSAVQLGAFAIAEDRDLARYEVQGEFDYFTLADGSPNNDDPIWVFGNSSGDGVVTTLKGHVTGVGGMTLKIDAEIVGGNSGSPIVNAEGKVVGIASYLKNGSNGRDWTTRDTEFDKVRRFGLRFTGVRWLAVDKKTFAEECGLMASFETYYSLLTPYLRCLDVSDEELATLKLEQKDIDRRRFGNYDEGFHDMLLDLSKSFDGKGRSWVGWMSVMERRDAVIKELNDAISSGELSYDNAVKALDEFDRKNDVTKKWDKVKERNRAFIAKRKEALLMARSFLAGRAWHDPRMRRGDADNNWCSVEWYLEAVAYWLDQNAQKLKDVNAALKQLEKGDEDED